MSGGLSCQSSVYKLNLLRLEYAYMLAFKLHKLYLTWASVVRYLSSVYSSCSFCYARSWLPFTIRTQNHEKWRFYTPPIHGLSSLKNEGFTWETPWKPKKNPRQKTKKTMGFFGARGPCHFSWILWVGILGLATSRGGLATTFGVKNSVVFFSVLRMVDTKMIRLMEEILHHQGW